MWNIEIELHVHHKHLYEEKLFIVDLTIKNPIAHILEENGVSVYRGRERAQAGVTAR